jgi:hypothetical protein
MAAQVDSDAALVAGLFAGLSFAAGLVALLLLLKKADMHRLSFLAVVSTATVVALLGAGRLVAIFLA